MALFGAQEYLISYRYVVKDAMFYNEKLYIAHSMQKCQGVEQEPLTLLLKRPTNSLRQIIEEHQEQFLSYIQTLGIDIDHSEKTMNLQNSSTTIFTLKTTCFKVDINDNFAIIAPLK